MNRPSAIIYSIILLISVTILHVGCARGEKIQPIDRDAAMLNAEGLQLIGAGEYDLAIEKLEAAVERVPDGKTYATNLAFGYYRAGRTDDAIREFERGISLNPDDALIHYDYGRLLNTAGYFDNALPQLQRAVELAGDDAKSPDILFELSTCYEGLGDTDSAIETIRKAIAKTPEAGFYTKIGDMLQEMGDIEGAEAEYLNAIDLSPNYAPAMNNLGLMYSANDRKDEAFKLFEMMLERDPYNGPAHNNLSLEYWEQGDYELAIESIKNAIKSDPTNGLYHFHHAMFLHDSGDVEEAMEQLQISLQYNPTNFDAVAKLNEWRKG